MKKKILLIGFCCALVFTMAACGGKKVESENRKVIGVIVASKLDSQTEEKTTTMLIDGKEKEYLTEDKLFEKVQKEWDDYSHWGMYQAKIEDGIITELEYGKGVKDILGIYSNHKDKKVIKDVISLEGNTVEFHNVDNILVTDENADVPGFSSKNEEIKPLNGQKLQLSKDIVMYVEGEGGGFFTGDKSYITKPGYDYIEFYDVDGDKTYDQVIVWRTDY